jgi:hypothetical protein
MLITTDNIDRNIKMGWLKQILQDAKEKIKNMPDWKLSDEYKKDIKKLELKYLQPKNNIQQIKKLTRFNLIEID